jgi:hypothetical protein
MQMKVIARLTLAAVTSTIMLGMTVQSSRAYFGNDPWCAVVNIGTGDVLWDCQYRTLEECVPNVLAGNRGFCNLSPWYEPKPLQTRKHRKRPVQLR